VETNIVLVAFILFIRPNVKINVCYGENSLILYVGMKSVKSIGKVKFFKDVKRESSQLFSILNMFKKRHFYQCVS
jgi:hypothetical protein